MDEFLRDIHTLLFKEWILIQSIEGCDIKEESKKSYSYNSLLSC